MSLIRIEVKQFFWLTIVLMLAFPTGSPATTVRMQTVTGEIDIELFDNEASLTVANFLNYVNSGAYDNSIIHRSVPGFIIQGGGYAWNSTTGTAPHIPQNAPVVNEFSVIRSNLRGTIAMAKLGNDPNSATSEWFFNLADNSANLDNQNSGFTVFGKVMANGMQVVDAIAALPWVNAGGAFSNLPLSTPYDVSAGWKSTNFVVVSKVQLVPSMNLPVYAGWNLLSSNIGLQVTKAFGDSSTFTSVWKWANGKWAVYLPGEYPPENYAAAKSFDQLMTINSGEGFWVNATGASSVTIPGTPVDEGLTFASGWNLVGLKSEQAATIEDLIAGKSGILSVWKWDNGNWAVYLPEETTPGAYAQSKGFAVIDTINPGEGFWVNAP